MNNVISLLIDAQCEVEKSMTISPNIIPMLHKNQCDDSKVANFHDSSVSVAVNKKCHTHNHRDINYPSKLKGYIATQPTEFKFVGPDRPGIDTKDSEQYLKLAKTITESGVSNYRQVRVPIKSDLNIEAWRRQLYDYKDQVLLQYLEYGFPLSIKESKSLTEQSIINHSSATQHHQAVSSYLAKESHFGAIVGPILKVQDYAIHCSPLLTRPKDVDRHRVILDLSYPKGSSLNDQVDKNSFDASAFILKLPSIDDIVKEIRKYGDDATLSKIDVARAFCNLRVDPADAIKLIKGLNGRMTSILTLPSRSAGSMRARLSNTSATPSHT